MATGSNQVRTVRGNFWVIAVGVICQKVLHFVALVVIARTFVLSDYGAFAAATAFAYVAATLADFGLLTHTWLAIARSPQSTSLYFAYGMAAKALIGPVALVAALVVGRAVHLPATSVELIPILAIGFICQSAMELTFAVFRAREQMQFEAMLIATYEGLLLAAAIAVRASHSSVVVLAVLWTIAGALGLILSVSITLSRFGGVPSAIRLSEMARWLLAGLPFAAYAIVVAVFFRGDVVVVAAVGGAAIGGLYAAAVTVPSVFLTGVQALLQAALARLTQNFEADLPKFHTLAQHTLRLSAALGAVASAITWLVAAPALEIIFGPRFTGLARLLDLMSAGLVPSFVAYCLVYVLNAAHAVRLVTGTIAAAVIANVALNIWLVPVFSATGAVASYVLAQVLLVALLGTVYSLKVKRLTLPIAQSLGLVVCVLAATVLSAIPGRLGFVTFVTMLPIAVMALLVWRSVLQSGDRGYVSLLIRSVGNWAFRRPAR